MLRNIKRLAFLLIVCLAPFTGVGDESSVAAAARAQAAKAAAAQTQAAQPASQDLAKQPTLYVVAYAHLDTEWRWDFVTTIRDYLPKTMRLNFDWFEKYPHYVFNFSGANRYRMIKEYYPADYERLKKYVGGPLVPVGLVDGGKRRKFPFGRVDHPPDPVRKNLVPP